MDGSAIITHGCCACAGMLPLPHGTHLHPTRVPACLEGTRSTTDCLLHAGGQRRQQGAATALPMSRARKSVDLATAATVACYRDPN